MSLTTGRGPLSGNPAGRFTSAMPQGVAYIEPFRRRVRGLRDGRAMIDSERVLLVHRPGRPPAYLFPAEDVDGAPTEPEPDAPGYVYVRWDAVDAWYEEDEQVSGHPRNPYHRIDCLRSRRHLHVEVAGVTLVDTTDTIALYETALDPKLYVHPSLVQMEFLVPSPTRTYCPYKGTASYWSAVIGETTIDDVAWCYGDPLPESLAIKGLLSFEPTRAGVETDLPPAAWP